MAIVLKLNNEKLKKKLHNIIGINKNIFNDYNKHRAIKFNKEEIKKTVVACQLFVPGVLFYVEGNTYSTFS